MATILICLVGQLTAVKVKCAICLGGELQEMPAIPEMFTFCSKPILYLDMVYCSLASQTLYRLVLTRSEGSGHSCTHSWCSWNALISVWDFCLKPDVCRITLRV